MTNRYGDLLKELHDGIVNNNLPMTRMDEIQRVFNELNQKIEQAGKGTKLDNPEIYQPNFISTPLRTWHCYMSTNQTISTSTFTPITFETSGGDNSVFDFWEEDKSKIRIDRSKFNVSIDGIIAWEPNTTNDRVLRIQIYDSDDTLIASNEFLNAPTSNSAGFGMKQNFAYTEDIRGIFPNVAYMQFEVYQNSGGDLDVENAILSVRIA